MPMKWTIWMLGAAMLLGGCNGGSTPDNGTSSPKTINVKVETTKGTFVIECHPEWAPKGVERFVELVKSGYFTDVAFFRVVPGFMAQFGIHGDPQMTVKWQGAKIQDDPVVKSNQRGFVSFATSGPNSRTTQLFINFKDNSFLDVQGFSPIGRVSEGSSVVDSLYADYGDGPPRGRGPNQGRIQGEGNAYLRTSFPKLDYIKRMTILE